MVSRCVSNGDSTICCHELRRLCLLGGSRLCFPGRRRCSRHIGTIGRFAATRTCHNMSLQWPRLLPFLVAFATLASTSKWKSRLQELAGIPNLKLAKKTHSGEARAQTRCAAIFLDRPSSESQSHVNLGRHDRSQDLLRGPSGLAVSSTTHSPQPLIEP